MKAGVMHLHPGRPWLRLLILLGGVVLGAPGVKVAWGAPGKSPPASRVAVLVGANIPAPGRVPLLFGHDDARKMASVLIGVAGFRSEDVFVLADPPAGDLMAALQTAADRLADRPESLLYFYYSGHADDQAIYPAGQRLPLGRLRALIDTARVTVRIGMVDACHGGGWTRAKGLSAEAPFSVRWPLSLDNEGSVLIASSSGLENAHESDRLRGSFFTHHFAVGLRGAADRNGNGEVTVSEAFEYAKERTIRDTLEVAREAQHPSYAVNLRGRRDLVLAQISQSSSTLQLSQEEGPLELVHLESGVALLELPPGPRHVRLAVPPGIYLVRKKFPERIATREVAVQAGTSTSVDEAELTLVGDQRLVAKGAVESATPDPPLLLREPAETDAPMWVKVAAVGTVTAAAASFVLAYKIALDIKSVNRDADPFRRYPCQDNPADVLCGPDRVNRLAPVSPDESRYVAGLQEEGKRFERYQYLALGAGAGFVVLSLPFLIKWTSAGERSGVAATWRSLALLPTWAGGPGFAAAARF